MPPLYVDYLLLYYIYRLQIILTTGSPCLIATWKSSGPWAGAVWTKPVPFPVVTWFAGNNGRPPFFVKGCWYVHPFRCIPVISMHTRHYNNFARELHLPGMYKVTTSTCSMNLLEVGADIYNIIKESILIVREILYTDDTCDINSKC